MSWAFNCLGGSERIRPRTLVVLLCFASALSFLFFRLLLYFGWEVGTHATPLFPASLGHTLPACTLQSSARLVWVLCFFFSCGILAVGLPGITSVASAHSSSTWSRALSWASVCHVLQDASRALWILFNRIVSPLMLPMAW
jgi:hypothetical protein